MAKRWITTLVVSATVIFVGVAFVILHYANLEVNVTDSGNRLVFSPTIEGSPSKGTEVKLLAGTIYDVAVNYEKCITQQYFPMGDSYAPIDVKLSWKSPEGALAYTVKLSREKDLSGAIEYETTECEMTLSDLYAGTHYYYQVIAEYEDKTVKSRVFDFTTAALPRTILIEGVSNTRDIGGYVTEDGKHRIRQGMVYRGGTMDEITKVGRSKALNNYGIKTDLDIRNSDEGATTSPLGGKVNYIKVGGPYYIGNDGINSARYREALLKEIRTFADKENYPIYVHCSLGKDRTGTICFLINALCGVQKEDLYLDYELSYLSARGCLDTGAPPEYSVNVPFTNLYTYIYAYRSEGTLADKTEQFMLELGVTKEEIAAIRTIMLEQVE